MRLDPDVHSAWLRHPSNTAFVTVLGWTLWAFVLENTPWLARWDAVLIWVGAAAVVAAAWLLEGPERATFDGDELRRVRPWRKDEVLPVTEINDVGLTYVVKVGWRLFVGGAPPRVAFVIDPDARDVRPMLEALGERLEVLGLTKVVADEKTRRALGVPGGGMRDPWTPSDRRPPE